MQVRATRHRNTLHLHPFLWSISNEDRQVVTLLKNSHDLNSMAGIVLRPVVQTINPNGEVFASECRANLPRFGNTGERHSLPDQSTQ